MRFSEMEPRLIERDRHLGWLAVSPDRAKLRIGVEGDTEALATAHYYQEAKEWERLCAMEPAIDISGLREPECICRTGRRRHVIRKQKRSVEAIRKKWAARPPLSRLRAATPTGDPQP